MNCPKCSSRLGWNDGAFCKSCMAEGSEIAQLRADLATAQKEAKRCADGWDALHATSRADLATVTAERDAALEMHQEELTAERRAHAGTREALAEAVYDRDYLDSERQREMAAHAETRKALEDANSNWHSACDVGRRLESRLESTRAALAKAEARVKELEELRPCGKCGARFLNDTPQGKFVGCNCVCAKNQASPVTEAEQGLSPELGGHAGDGAAAPRRRT